MMELVSMIIPVYGVEAYLGECLETVLNQTYRNLEIILIDDESPDRCPEICDQYAYKNIFFIVVPFYSTPYPNRFLNLQVNSNDILEI